MPILILAKDNDEIHAGHTVSKFVESAYKLSLLHDWEDFHGFTFLLRMTLPPDSKDKVKTAQCSVPAMLKKKNQANRNYKNDFRALKKTLHENYCISILKIGWISLQYWLAPFGLLPGWIPSQKGRRLS